MARHPVGRDGGARARGCSLGAARARERPGQSGLLDRAPGRWLPFRRIGGSGRDRLGRRASDPRFLRPGRGSVGPTRPRRQELPAACGLQPSRSRLPGLRLEQGRRRRALGGRASQEDHLRDPRSPAVGHRPRIPGPERRPGGLESQSRHVLPVHPRRRDPLQRALPRPHEAGGEPAPSQVLGAMERAEHPGIFQRTGSGQRVSGAPQSRIRRAQGHPQGQSRDPRRARAGEALPG